MTPITDLDSLFITGLSATVLALLTWIVLCGAAARTVASGSNVTCIAISQHTHVHAPAVASHVARHMRSTVLAVPCTATPRSAFPVGRIADTVMGMWSAE